jgi:hypothetical protein
MIEIDFEDDETALEDLYLVEWLVFTDGPDEDYRAIVVQLYAQMLGWV